MLKLIGTDGRKLYSWDLLPGKYSIGRKSECDFFIQDNTVSRNHAELIVNDDNSVITLTDLGSHNGTTVNGFKIIAPTEIKAGDNIIFGQVEFRISSEDGTSRSKVPTTQLSKNEPEKSVFLDINEALKPLPSKVTDRPEVLPALFEIAKMLILNEPKEVMLDKSLKLISKVITSERLAILFTEEGSDEVYTAASFLKGGKDPGEFRISRTIIKQILSDPQAILISDTTRDPNFAEQHSIIMSELKSAMAVPLFDEAKVHGVLYADTSNPLHQYNDEHLRLLATFGNIIGSRLQNYTLLSEREEKQILDAELKRASSIQKKLLLKNNPEIPGYNLHSFQEQCRAVGGDLYDMHVMPDGRLLFMVADVSGKGLGAALLMANILASFRILYNQPDFNLCDTVKKVSSQLVLHSDSGDYATLFIGILDPVNHNVCYVNAGHNPPMLVKGDGSFKLLNESGIPIGAMDFDLWPEGHVALEPDDFILIFTDGVTEAESIIGQYGETRLEKFVSKNCSFPADKICDNLVEEVLNFVEDYPRSDDITMMIVQRK